MLAGAGDHLETRGNVDAMDEDTAYVEAVGSARAMASLQFLGLPLPQDALGGTLRYQTDHVEVGRATSCGDTERDVRGCEPRARRRRLGAPMQAALVCEDVIW